MDIGHGDVLISAITSCTKHFEPRGASRRGTVAKKAVEKGIEAAGGREDLAGPGSSRRDGVPEDARLLPYLEQLGYYVAGYGCTKCIGNRGRSIRRSKRRSTRNDLVCAAVLSGNRNFEARITSRFARNFLMSPPLVVAFGLAGHRQHRNVQGCVGQRQGWETVTCATYGRRRRKWRRS